jgi:hypothetical protein
MQFRDHSRLSGSHAFLSPSNPSWVNYDEEKLDRTVIASMAAKRGSDLHELAQRMIRLGVKLPKTAQTLNMYVNDCIGFRMTPEQMLFYSLNCYGQADAISFSKNKLRIFDLKTGINRCKMTQLEIYAALFCLEYNFKPKDIEIELRIYQNDAIEIEVGDVLSITSIMELIVFYDRRVDQIREEV